MTKQELIGLLNEDLKYEFHHMHAYLHASTLVTGLHRHEIAELLLEEAKSELEHCHQFAQLIVHLGGGPVTSGHPIDELKSVTWEHPTNILEDAMAMEDVVAARYSERLRQTEGHENPETSYVHVFYEEQIADSWKTAREFQLMLAKLS